MDIYTKLIKKPLFLLSLIILIPVLSSCATTQENSGNNSDALLKEYDVCFDAFCDISSTHLSKDNHYLLYGDYQTISQCNSYEKYTIDADQNVFNPVIFNDKLFYVDEQFIDYEIGIRFVVKEFDFLSNSSRELFSTDMFYPYTDFDGIIHDSYKDIVPEASPCIKLIDYHDGYLYWYARYGLLMGTQRDLFRYDIASGKQELLYDYPHENYSSWIMHPLGLVFASNQIIGTEYYSKDDDNNIPHLFFYDEHKTAVLDDIRFSPFIYKDSLCWQTIDKNGDIRIQNEDRGINISVESFQKSITSDGNTAILKQEVGHLKYNDVANQIEKWKPLPNYYSDGTLDSGALIAADCLGLFNDGKYHPLILSETYVNTSNGLMLDARQSSKYIIPQLTIAPGSSPLIFDKDSNTWLDLKFISFKNTTRYEGFATDDKIWVIGYVYDSSDNVDSIVVYEI